MGHGVQRVTHLTPSLFLKEFQKMGRPDPPVYAYHMKPLARNQIKEQIRRLGIERVAFLDEAQIITV